MCICFDDRHYPKRKSSWLSVGPVHQNMCSIQNFHIHFSKSPLCIAYFLFPCIFVNLWTIMHAFPFLCLESVILIHVLYSSSSEVSVLKIILNISCSLRSLELVMCLYLSRSFSLRFIFVATIDDKFIEKGRVNIFIHFITSLSLVFKYS